MEHNDLWWLKVLDPREAMEVRHALDYVARFNHGTPGHMDLTVIAKLAVIASHAIYVMQKELSGDSPSLVDISQDIRNWIDGMLAAPKP